MKINKLLEVIKCLQEVEPDADVVLDTFRNNDEILPDSVYDLTGINIEYKNNIPMIKLLFEERVQKKPEHKCRMKNMNIRALDLNQGGSDNE